MLSSLQKKLHKQIPMTKLMGLEINEINKKELITSAPLEININDKGTGFAGSLSTLVTISAWSACFLEVSKLGYDESMIAIIKSDTSYKAPVKEDLVCKTILPTKEELEILERKLKDKNSASIKIKSQIIEKENICVDFEGIYVIKI